MGQRHHTSSNTLDITADGPNRDTSVGFQGNPYVQGALLSPWCYGSPHLGLLPASSRRLSKLDAPCKLHNHERKTSLKVHTTVESNIHNRLSSQRHSSLSSRYAHCLNIKTCPNVLQTLSNNLRLCNSDKNLLGQDSFVIKSTYTALPTGLCVSEVSEMDPALVALSLDLKYVVIKHAPGDETPNGDERRGISW